MDMSEERTFMVTCVGYVCVGWKNSADVQAGWRAGAWKIPGLDAV